MGLTHNTVTVANRLGLHARPAAELVKVAAKFRSEIHIAKDGMWVNAKSILGVMTLAAEQGSVLEVKANGEDSNEAVAAMVAVVQRDWDFSDV